MSNELSYRGYMGTMECSAEDGCIHGRILFIDDLITYEADTVPEIKTAFEEAVDDYLEYCERTGKPANKPYSGTFNVRIGPDLHKHAAECATRSGMKLNEFVLNAVKQAVQVSCGIHINHHHDHAVTVTLLDDGVTTLGFVASTDQPPSTWREVPPIRLN